MMFRFKKQVDGREHEEFTIPEHCAAMTFSRQA